MAFCRNCGNQLNDGIKFCPKCGQAVVGVNQQQVSQQPPQGQNLQSPQEQHQQSQNGKILKYVEYFFYFMATLDFCLGNFKIADITGVWWSPILFGAIGAAIGQYYRKKYGITDN